MEQIEEKCLAQGIRMTEQRRIVARVIATASDHPAVDEVHRRAAILDPNISMATVYRTVRLLEEAGVIDKHDFGGGRARYELAGDEHHDHLINVKTGEVIEFYDEEIEKLKSALAERLGFRLIDHRLELYGIPDQDEP